MMHSSAKAAAIGVSLAAALTGAALTAASASASQGGCTNHQVDGGQVGVCINDRNTGRYGFADYYVNSVISPGNNCLINIEGWDNNGHRYGAIDYYQSCAVGHHPSQPFQLTVSGCVNLHTYLRVFINGSWDGNTGYNSPSIHVCA